MRIVVIAALAIVLGGQQPALEITAPRPDTIVRPGESIVVAVSSPTKTPIRALMVVGEHIGFFPGDATLPARVTVTVPRDIAAGRHRLSAVAATMSDRELAAAIDIDVERTDAPVSLWVQSPRLFFAVPGAALPLLLRARFADGGSLDVHESSRVTYKSSDETVATVDHQGLVTSVGPGRATVTITYKGSSAALTQSVSVNVPVPALVPSSYSLSFAEQVVGTSSAPQPVTLTNRRAGPVRVIDIRTTPYYSQTNDCPPQLRAGGSCTIAVVFKPTQPGDAPGDLEISSSADALPLTIPLKGLARPRARAVPARPPA